MDNPTGPRSNPPPLSERVGGWTFQTASKSEEPCGAGRRPRKCKMGGGALQSDVRVYVKAVSFIYGQRAAQASPDHGFCGVRARAGEPSCLELR